MTTQAKVSAIEVRAIDPQTVSQLLVLDDAGQPPRVRVDRNGGSPLRCCLRHSESGERIALVSYAPLRRWAAMTGADPGPYDEVGPIFLHADPCGGPSGDGFPAAFTRIPRVLRAYSANGRILGGRLASAADVPDPEAAGSLIEGIFADPKVALVHARAVEFGCFTFEIRRREEDQAGGG